MLKAGLVALGAFTGMLIAQALIAISNGMPWEVVPNHLFLSILTCLFPAILLLLPYSAVSALLHRTLRPWSLFGLAVLAGVICRVLPEFMVHWEISYRIRSLIYFPLVAGTALAFAGQRDLRKPQPTNTVSWPGRISRALSTAEGVILVIPLLGLLPLGLFLHVIENRSRPGSMCVGLIVIAAAAWGLISLFRLLHVFRTGGAPALRLTSRNSWVACIVGLALVIAGYFVVLLEFDGTLPRGAQSPIGAGIIVVPALLPLLHMTLERWRARS